jgi:hypothetical protein
MNRRPANHYVVIGSGVDGVIDTSSFGGHSSVTIRIDEKPLNGVKLRESEHGIEVTGLVEQVPDSHSVYLRLTVPRVNVERESVPFAGLALLATPLILTSSRDRCINTRCVPWQARRKQSSSDLHPPIWHPVLKRWRRLSESRMLDESRTCRA